MATQIYIVQPGDSLSAISRKLFGDFSMTDRLAEMNKITNVNLIHPGQQLLVPNVKDAIAVEAVAVDDNGMPASSGSSIDKKKIGKWIGLGFVVVAGILLAREAMKQKKKNKSLSGEIEARELELYAINDGNLYRQRIQPIIKNLKKKKAKGTFDKEKSLKLWKYAADDAAKRYEKEFGSPGGRPMFSVADRKEVAKAFADHYAEEINE